LGNIKEFKKMYIDNLKSDPPARKPRESIESAIDNLSLMGFSESEIVVILPLLNFKTASGKAPSRTFVRNKKANFSVGHSDDKIEKPTIIDEGNEWDGKPPPNTPYVVQLIEKLNNIELRISEAECVILEMAKDNIDSNTIAETMNSRFMDVTIAVQKKWTKSRIDRFISKDFCESSIEVEDDK